MDRMNKISTFYSSYFSFSVSLPPHFTGKRQGSIHLDKSVYRPSFAIYTIGWIKWSIATFW